MYLTSGQLRIKYFNMAQLVSQYQLFTFYGSVQRHPVVILRPRKIIKSTWGVIFSEAYDFGNFLPRLLDILRPRKIIQSTWGVIFSEAYNFGNYSPRL